MSVENLWGDLSLGKETRTPYTILREQADLLNEMTEEALVGHVTRIRREAGLFTFNLEISSEAIRRYSYRLLQVDFPPSLYPLTMSDFTNDVEYESENEEKFIKDLGEILSSEKVKKAVLGLVSQSKAMTE